MISIQGYAITQDQYRDYFTSSSRKRRELQSGIVHSEQLAAELTAASYRMVEDLKAAVSNSNALFCHEIGELSDWQKMLVGNDATQVARQLLKNPLISGRWIANDLLETWTCMETKISSITFLPNHVACYERLKANYTE